MKRAALYSSAQGRSTGGPVQEPPEPERSDMPEAPPPGWRKRVGAKLRAFGTRRRRPLLVLGVLALACVPVLVFWSLQTPPTELTQEDFDDAVLHTLANKSLPSRTAKAAEAVRQSVVRVRGTLDDDPPKDAKDAPKDSGSARAPKDPRDKKASPREQAKDNARAEAPPKVARPDLPKGAPGKGGLPDKGSKAAGKAGDKSDNKIAGAPPMPRERGMSIGSGVVILDKGVILTNLHVVAGAKRLFVTFFDGMESEADLVGAFPENDLAVLKARRIPDDLPAATLGSSSRLKPGDEVVAVGFPFDIGPSVSAGVVSGLNREFRSPNGERSLTKLIQFDAAANSGNSGGPLVTMDGEVVGIVTAILNPNGAGTFVGIGFAVTIEGAGSAVGIPPF